MSTSWLEIAGNRFSTMVRSIIEDCASSVLEEGLGNEDPQCQHLFTSIFCNLKAQQNSLSRLLIEDSKVPDLAVIFKYYRSRIRRNNKCKDKKIQFVESETGADFALSEVVPFIGPKFLKNEVKLNISIF